jgi:hypothetical protein
VNRHCFTAEDIAALKADDPRMEHVTACPRCSALLASFRVFQAQLLELPPEKLREFRSRFAAALGAETARPQARWRNLFARPAWGWAGLLLICIVAWRIWFHPGREAAAPVLRGRADSSAVLTTQTPESMTGGHIRLSWSVHPDADAYRIVFLTPIGTEVAERQVTASPCTVAADSLRALAPKAQRLIWRVAALRGGDEIAQSLPRAIHLGSE